MKTYLFLVIVSVLMLAGYAQAQPVAANRDIEPVPINLDSVKRVIGYPILAKEAEIQGDVIARVKIDSTGAYVKHYILYACHPILGDAVEAQLSNLRFTPGKIDGHFTPVWMTIPLKFRFLSKKPGPFSVPPGGGFFLLADDHRKQIDNPFGTGHADILSKVSKNKVNGKRPIGIVYFWMEFDAQCSLEDVYSYGSENPAIRSLVKKEIRSLAIDPDSPLRQLNVPFRIFVPFTFN